MYQQIKQLLYSLILFVAADTDNCQTRREPQNKQENHKIMQNKDFSEAQSLELITSMIQDSRARLARNSGTPFLIWGYTTVAISILNYILFQYDIKCWWLWWLIPLIGWAGMMIWGKHDNGAKNYIDRVISIIWSVIGVSFLWIMFAFVYYHAPILFLVILLAGMGTTMTGFVIRDKATQIGGILAMASSILFPLKHWLMIRFVDLNDIALQSEWMSTDFLLFAAIFLFMMVIPGHILNHKYNK